MTCDLVPTLEEAFILRFFCHTHGMMTAVPFVPDFLRILARLELRDAPDLREEGSAQPHLWQDGSIGRTTNIGSSRGGRFVLRLLGHGAAGAMSGVEGLRGQREEWERLVWLLRDPPCEVRSVTSGELQRLVEWHAPGGMPVWASWVPVRVTRVLG